MRYFPMSKNHNRDHAAFTDREENAQCTGEYNAEDRIFRADRAIHCSDRNSCMSDETNTPIRIYGNASNTMLMSIVLNVWILSISGTGTLKFEMTLDSC